MVCPGRPARLAAQSGSNLSQSRAGRSSVSLLTIHSSRSRFAARLNSGVRPLRAMLPQLRPAARRRNAPPALPSASWRSAPTSFNGSCLPQRRRAHVASRGSRHASTLVRRSVSSQLSCCALVRLVCRLAQAPACNRLPCARAPACPGLLLLCALTIHSSRRRFAARLNSGVRCHWKVCR